MIEEWDLKDLLDVGGEALAVFKDHIWQRHCRRSKSAGRAEARPVGTKGC